MSSISSLLPASHILIDLPAADKRAVFVQVAAVLETTTGVDSGVIVDSLLARERLGSTGLGQGIAIPHGRVRGLRAAIGAFVRTRDPIEFEAPDQRAVNLIFVLLVPEQSTDLHLELLGRLARMFSDREMRARLAAATDAVEVQHLIADWDARTAR